MRHRAVMNVSCLRTKWRFSFSVPLRASSQKLLLKRTTAGRRILSTTSLTLFEVLLSMIVLPAAQVLHQSSAGMASRAAAKGASAASKAGCVSVACLVVRVLFLCAADCSPFSVCPLPPACLAADISLRRSDFLCMWPVECTSFSGAAVSQLGRTLSSSGCLPVF